MTYLRGFLGAATLVIFAYTAVVAARHGMGFVPAYIGVLFSLTWPGQFSLDFGVYLALCALWVAWRHGFSASGVAFACVTLVLGAMVFLPYLLWLSLRPGADAKSMVLGLHHTAPEGPGSDPA